MMLYHVDWKTFTDVSEERMLHLQGPALQEAFVRHVDN